MTFPAARHAPAPAGALVIGSVTSVQVGAALAKRLFPVVGSAGAVTLRLVMAALLLALVARGVPRRPGRRATGLVLAFGAVLAAMNLSFYAALDRIPLGVAVTVEFAGPLAVAVLGSRRPRDLGWAALAAAGVVLLTGGGGSRVDGALDPLGVGLALLAAACWAAYILLSQRVGAALPGFQGLVLALVVAAVLVTPVGIAEAGSALLRPEVLVAGLGVGLLSSALPWGMELVALRSIGAGSFGVLMSLEPAVAALSGFLLLGEHLAAVQVAAIGLTCVASAGAARGSRRRRTHPAAGSAGSAGSAGPAGSAGSGLPSRGRVPGGAEPGDLRGGREDGIGLLGEQGVRVAFPPEGGHRGHGRSLGTDHVRDRVTDHECLPGADVEQLERAQHHVRCRLGPGDLVPADHVLEVTGDAEHPE